MHDHFAKSHRIELKYTTTYHPECNGMIERLHRWIKERMALITYDGRLNFEEGEDNGSEYLDIIQLTYNTIPNVMTSYSPFDLILGDSLLHPQRVKFDPETCAEYLRFIKKELR